MSPSFTLNDVGFESWLERDHVMLMDFHLPAVLAALAEPVASVLLGGASMAWRAAG